MRFFRFLVACTAILIWQSFSQVYSSEENGPASSSSYNIESIDSHELYDGLDLASHGLSYTAFETAVMGMQQLIRAGMAKNYILSIADLSQSSCEKRLYIIDLIAQQLLFQTYVAHGRNSGEEFANSFSNQSSSYKSSLGFYTTLETYEGEHGLSLRLQGMEDGINDNAFDRAIVLHGADYVSAEFIKENGRLGRSLGCPAVSPELTKDIIDVLKNGSCFFIYYPDQAYLKMSKLLNS